MPEYLIRKKYLGRPARTVVKTPDDLPQFLLVGTWGVKGDALSVYSMSGDLLASVKKVPWSFGIRYDLYDSHEKVATMKRIFHFNVDFYYIQNLGWHVLGDVSKHHYTVHSFTRKVMTMDSATFPNGDYYVLDIPESQEAPLAICVASVLDYWLYEEQKQKKFNFRPGLSLD